ncbi:hypothetical protein ASC94_09275 [Massilia sp. Root418]|uniref:hypothetical protein n=1 Tax=Massilia sp. Root418 TaxID=1736532 RepID=UPI0006FEA995|nr:hypothetical protein [Massilia sp. Root418]KQW96988.1 hypothetical protein ASC94_09275 [Massilia sp. Root418]
MSGLGALASTAAGQGWKIASAVLASLLLAVGAGGGAAWWMADRAREQAVVDLRAEQKLVAELRQGIGTQNAAIAVLGEQKLAAEARGAAARAQAAADGERYGEALQQLNRVRVTTCADAMPYVNKLLEDMQ